MKEVLLNEVLVVLLPMNVAWALSRLLPMDTWWGFLVHVFVTLIITAITIWTFGLTRKERADWKYRLLNGHD